MSFPTSDSKYCRTPSCDWSEWVDNPDLTNDTLVTQDTLGRDSCNQTLDLDAPCTDIILEPSLCPYLFNGRFDDYEHWHLNDTIQESWLPPAVSNGCTLAYCPQLVARGTLDSGGKNETVFIAAIDVHPDGTARAWAFSGSLANTYKALDTLTLHGTTAPPMAPPLSLPLPPMAPPPHPPLYPTTTPPLAPFPPTAPNYPADAATKTVTASLTVKGFSCDDKEANEVKIAKYLSVPSVTIKCLSDSRRRRRLTDDTTITVTIPTTDANHDTVLASAYTLFVSDPQTATALLGGSVYSGASVSGTSSGGADKDPHLAFPHGGTADFRGRHGVFYNFFSSPGFAVNVKTEDATFKLRNSKLIVDGSFITEVHLVARTGSAISNASFWAEELSDFNTGSSPPPPVFSHKRCPRGGSVPIGCAPGAQDGKSSTALARASTLRSAWAATRHAATSAFK